MVQSVEIKNERLVYYSVPENDENSFRDEDDGERDSPAFGVGAVIHVTGRLVRIAADSR